VIALLLGGAALAGPPSRVAVTLEAGSAVADVEVSGDGSAVALSDESGGSIYVLDVGTWSLVDVTPCDSPAGLVADPSKDGRFWVGCLDGSVVWLDFASGAVTYATESVSISQTPVLGLTASEDTLFGLVDNSVEGAVPEVHTVSLTDLSVDAGSGYPSVVGATGFQDIAYSGTGVYVTHGGSQITRMEGGSGAATLQQQSVSGASTGDIQSLPGINVLVAGGSAGVLNFETGSNRLVSLLNADEGVDEATALGVSLDEGYLLVADSSAAAFQRFDVSDSTGMPSSGSVDSLVFPSDVSDVTEIGVIDGYAFAGTSDGKVMVLTDRPWVEADDPSPNTAVAGSEVSVDFVADVGGSWEARLNGTDNEDGKRVAKGSLSADEVATATFTVGSSFQEGTNRIRIVVTDEDGVQGHDTSTVSVDNPPSTVNLRSSHAGWGDELIELTIPGISDEDLSEYVVYVSTENFEGEEYSTGGPGFVGATDDLSGSRLNLPRTVSADPGQDKQITIAPLTNGVTYYVAVRATDEAGQEGEMSKIVSVTPQETYGASDLAGEKGGYGCSTSAKGAATGLGLLGLLSVFSRRRLVPMAALLVGLSLPAQADADWPQKVKGWNEVKGQTVEIRYGPIYFEDDSITSIFGETGNNMLMIEFGPTIYDLVEIKGSIGYFHGEASRVSASGASSSQTDYLNLYPVAVDVTGRLDVLPEQPVVPFAGVGRDYFFWREAWEGGGGSGNENISGGKSGWHTTYGAHILLDTFNGRRASKLQAVTGITDSYITVEYRNQEIGESQDGLKFSGNTLTFGLKFDH